MLSTGINCQPTFLNQIVRENQKAGTSSWRLNSRATNNEIACYLSALSINKGGSVDLKVHSTGNAAFNLEVYRWGYYGGTGARLFQTISNIPATTQAAPAIETTPRIRLTRCNWATTYTLQTSPNWISGYYWLRLVQSGTGKQTACILIVRDDDRQSDILYQAPVNDWLAYNNWNFDSSLRYALYDFRSSSPGRSMATSLDRPWSWATIDEEEDNPNTWDHPMIYWLESVGYSVKYCTSLDVHTQGTSILDKSKVFLSNGHDEYWSSQQYQAIEQARDNGKHLIFNGANNVYWRVRYEDTAQPGTGTEGDRRVMVCHKNNDLATATGVPADWIDDPVTPTNLFRSSQVIAAIGLGPESELLGVQFVGNTGGVSHAQPLVVAAANHPLFTGTGLLAGNLIGNLTGFEWDHVNPGANPVTSAEGQLTILATGTVDSVQTSYQSTFLQPGSVDDNTAHMTLYQSPGGGWVFSSGSLNSVFGLKEGLQLNGDPWQSGLNRESPSFQRFFWNLLQFLGCQSKAIVPTVNPVSYPGSISITGIPSVGNVLTASVSDSNGLPNTINYQWQVSDDNTDWTNISGANQNTLSVIQDYDAKHLRAIANYTDLSGFTESLTSDSVLVVTEILYSLFDGETPSNLDGTDGQPYELGKRFSVTRAGQITAIRYYKATSEASSGHIGRIWSNGSLIRSVNFENEGNGGGWKQQSLTPPLDVIPDTAYIVSVNALSHFAFSANTTPTVSGPLISPIGGILNTNSGSFPNINTANHYFRDIVFNPDPEESITPVGAQTLYENSLTPSFVNVDSTDGYYTMGVRLTFSVVGQIIGLRFYQHPNSAITHTGYLWRESDTTLLASKAYTGAIGGGWKRVDFNTPVPVVSGQVYVVGVSIQQYYAAQPGGLATPKSRGNISTAPGNNGVFASGSDSSIWGTLPTSSFNNNEYFVDCVFLPN